jgi:hypothetical protein
MPLSYKAALQKDKTTGAPQMQHRHFAFIASVIKASGERNEDKRRWATHFAVDLARTNPNFDRARFYTAAGVDDPYLTEAAYGQKAKA